MNTTVRFATRLELGLPKYVKQSNPEYYIDTGCIMAEVLSHPENVLSTVAKQGRNYMLVDEPKSRCTRCPLEAISPDGCPVANNEDRYYISDARLALFKKHLATGKPLPTNAEMQLVEESQPKPKLKPRLFYCPKCGGWMSLEQDEHKQYEDCINCGYNYDLTDYIGTTGAPEIGVNGSVDRNFWVRGR